MEELGKYKGISTGQNYSPEPDEDSLSYYSEYAVDSEREIEVSDLEYADDDEQEGKNPFPNPAVQFVPFSLIQTRRRLAQVNATWNSPNHSIDAEGRTSKVAFSEMVSVINFSADTSTPEDTEEGHESVGEELPKQNWHTEGTYFRGSDSVNVPDQIRKKEEETGPDARGDSSENFTVDSPADRNNTMKTETEFSTKIQSEVSEVGVVVPEIVKRKRLPKPKIISSPRYSEDSRTRFLQMVAKHSGRYTGEQCKDKLENFPLSPSCVQLEKKQIRDKRLDTPRIPRNKNSEIVPTITLSPTTSKKDKGGKNTSPAQHVLRIFTKKSLNELSGLGQGSNLLKEIRAQVVSQNISVKLLNSIFNDEFVSLLYNVEPVKSKWATKPDLQAEKPSSQKMAPNRNLVKEKVVEKMKVTNPISLQQKPISERMSTNSKSLQQKPKVASPKSLKESPISARKFANPNSMEGRYIFESDRKIKELVSFASPINSDRKETNARMKGKRTVRIAETNHKVLVLPSSARNERIVSSIKRPVTK